VELKGAKENIFQTKIKHMEKILNLTKEEYDQRKNTNNYSSFEETPD